MALFQKNFVLLTCRLILRFPQFLTFDGGWGNSFPLYQSYEIPITLSINSLGMLKTFFGISRQSLFIAHNLPKNTPICLYIHFYFLYSLFEIYSSTRFIKNERKSNVSCLYFIISESNIVDPKLE